MPTRRRDATMPIDSSTRIASRATLRDTPCSALTPSRVSTWPGARLAGHDPGAEGVDKIGVQLADVWLRGHGYIMSSMEIWHIKNRSFRILSCNRMTIKACYVTASTRE